MEEVIRRLNIDYGFGLTEDEIKNIVLQAHETHESFKPMYEVDLTGVTPFQKIDLRITE